MSLESLSIQTMTRQIKFKRSDKKLSVIVVVAGSLVSILEKKKPRPYGRIARQLSEN